MKRVRKIQRANAISAYDRKVNSVYRREKNFQDTRTRRGNERLMTYRRCPCGQWHWGTRDRRCIGKQKEVAALCNKCFRKKYKKNRPPSHYDLNPKSVKKIKREMEAQGCSVRYVDPATL